MAARRSSNVKLLANVRYAALNTRAAVERSAACSSDRASAPLAQATALYRAGASRPAQGVLDVALASIAPDHDAFAALVLALEIDADLGTDRIAAHRERWALRNAFQAGTADDFIDAGLAVIDMSTPGGANTRGRLHATLDRIKNGLLKGSVGDARLRNLLARLYADGVPALVELEGAAAGIAALDAAQSLIAGGRDVPADLQALIHVNRAFACSSSPQTLARAGGERSKARALAESNGLPRILWKCLYLQEFESIWRGDVPAALDDARTLFASVDASDSRSWRRIARSQLSNAHAASSDFVAAGSDVAEMATQHRLDSALHGCRLAYLQGRDADAIRQADTLTTLAGVPTSVCANARLYSAAAALRLADTKRAQSDIDEAVGLLELSSMPALFIAQRAYALAFRIIGRKRFRDAAHDIQLAFERAHRVLRRAPTRTVLTTRQREIAEMAAMGATNGAIASVLDISPRTVGNHLAAVFTALDIRARWQLADALGPAPVADD